MAVSAASAASTGAGARPLTSANLAAAGGPWASGTTATGDWSPDQKMILQDLNLGIKAEPVRWLANFVHFDSLLRPGQFVPAALTAFYAQHTVRACIKRGQFTVEAFATMLAVLSCCPLPPPCTEKYNVMLGRDAAEGAKLQESALFMQVVVELVELANTASTAAVVEATGAAAAAADDGAAWCFKAPPPFTSTMIACLADPQCAFTPTPNTRLIFAHLSAVLSLDASKPVLDVDVKSNLIDAVKWLTTVTVSTVGDQQDPANYLQK